MRGRLALVGLAVCLVATPQVELTVKQLVSFITSSSELGHSDKEVARYLRDVTLTEQLDDRTIVDLQAQGAGPRTVEALKRLRDASRSLPEPAPPKPIKAPSPIPPPPPEEQRQIIEQVRQYSLNYAMRLPDFICTQVTRRYVDPNGLEFWQRHDVITTKVTYFEQKEDYKVILVNDHPVEISYDDLQGSTSTGEFGSMLKEIFELESKAQFAWDRWATLRGKRAHVYRYRVSKARSKWTISYERTTRIVPAYTGLVYVDRDTLMVMRVTLDAVGIPPSFPIQQASTMLDYDYVTISGGEYMLPLRAVMRMRQGRLLVKNEVEFRLYRKFAAEATITFETPEPLPEEMTTEQPAEP